MATKGPIDPVIVGYIDKTNLQTFMGTHGEYSIVALYKTIPPLDKTVEPPFEFAPVYSEKDATIVAKPTKKVKESK